MGLIAGVMAQASTGAGAAPRPPLQLHHLQPGAPADVHQTVPVSIVFVGLEEGTGATAIDTDRLLDGQLRSSPLVDRATRAIEQYAPRDMRLEPSAIGLTYDWQYRPVFADQSFEDAFFGYLASIAEGPIPGGTIFQQAYSSHPLAAQPIDASYKIDAVSAERWLAANAGPMLGVDTTRPTVFLVNWFGRDDFRFHTYGFQGVRPGFPFALGDTHFGQMSSWGGTPPDPADAPSGPLARVWMHDVSAGPDGWQVNYVLDVGDLNGDGVDENRFPPIWEYGTSHWYRPFDDLTGDLSRIVRFTAIDALFGTSPVYDPALSEPFLSERAEIDLNLFAGREDRHPAATLRVADLPSIFGRLDPTRTFPVDAEVRPLDGRIGEIFDCQQTGFDLEGSDSCFGGRSRLPDDAPVGEAFFDLDFYLEDHANEYLDGTRYEIPVAVFDLPDVAPGFGLAGVAAMMPPNLQSWTYVWLTDRGRYEAWRTDTGLVSHEVGHHVGVPHPHDLYDPELGRDVEASFGGDYFHIYAGFATYTTMSYLPNTEEFGQFDRDNMARWQLTARFESANRILGDVVRSGRSGRATEAILAADAAAGSALQALAAWDLPAASAHARTAYRHALAAANLAKVHVEPFSGTADTLRGAGVIDAAVDPYHHSMLAVANPGNAMVAYG